MNIIVLLIILIIVGLIVGYLAGLIWKDNRPIGIKGDYIVAVLSTVAIGLLDYYVIPAMGFSETLRWLGVVSEPWIGALLILWVIRYAKK